MILSVGTFSVRSSVTHCLFEYFAIPRPSPHLWSRCLQYARQIIGEIAHRIVRALSKSLPQRIPWWGWVAVCEFQIRHQSLITVEIEDANVKKGGAEWMEGNLKPANHVLVSS